MSGGGRPRAAHWCLKTGWSHILHIQKERRNKIGVKRILTKYLGNTICISRGLFSHHLHVEAKQTHCVPYFCKYNIIT